MGDAIVTKIEPVFRFPSKRELRPQAGMDARMSTRPAAQLHSLAAQVSKLTRPVPSAL